jgi:hypothetical protein
LLRRISLHPFEWFAYCVLIGTVLLLTALGRPISGTSIRYTFTAMAGVLPAALLLGVALQAYYQWTERRPIQQYLQQLRSREWLLSWLRLWLACWAVSFSYFWVKVYVPTLHEGTWDSSLWQLDRWLHLGVSPSEFAVVALGRAPLVGWLDVWYGLWLASVVWSLAFFAASADSLLRRRVVLSALLLWTVGAIIYLLIPAVGPIYVFEETWSSLRGSMPIAEQAQGVLWSNYQAVLESRAGAPMAFDHRLGVAAFPSLHVAFHGLFALWAWQHARVVRVIFVLMALLTFAGSLLTGWHYAVDGYLGLALAVLCQRVAIWLERDRTEGQDRVASAPD